MISLNEERNAVKPAVVLELRNKQFVYKETIARKRQYEPRPVGSGSRSSHSVRLNPLATARRFVTTVLRWTLLFSSSSTA